MLFFANDYGEGCCEQILQRFAEVNTVSTPGYGNDIFCDSAKEKIRKACDAPEADIYFLTGGTQTNQTVISTVLQSYQGVVSADTGHVACHEAGAIEYTGHKVLTVPHVNGKLPAAGLQALLDRFYGDDSHDHMVFPGMVYISHPTEYGTLYSKAELEALSAVCRKNNLPLYMDGARLAYALACPETDVTLEDIARLTDVFYIGGTKCGALCGEAVVFPHHNMPPHFVTMVKQRGAMTAKGRLHGLQFDTLFTDGLYLQMGKQAMDMAAKLHKILEDKGYEFFIDSPTNQIFVVLPDEKMEELSKEVIFAFWEKKDDTHTVVRFATSWATSAEAVDALAALL